MTNCGDLLVTLTINSLVNLTRWFVQIEFGWLTQTRKFGMNFVILPGEDTISSNTNNELTYWKTFHNRANFVHNPRFSLLIKLCAFFFCSFSSFFLTSFTIPLVATCDSFNFFKSTCFCLVSLICYSFNYESRKLNIIYCMSPESIK